MSFNMADEQIGISLNQIQMLVLNLKRTKELWTKIN